MRFDANFYSTIYLITGFHAFLSLFWLTKKFFWPLPIFLTSTWIASCLQ